MPLNTSRGLAWLDKHNKAPAMIWPGVWRWILEDPPGKRCPSVHELPAQAFDFLRGDGRFHWEYNSRQLAIDDAAVRVTVWLMCADAMEGK